MSAIEQALPTEISRADYDNSRLCPLPQYHPEILATKLALKRTCIRNSMESFGHHQAQAAVKTADRKRELEYQSRRVHTAIKIDNNATQELPPNTELHVTVLLGRLAAGMQVMQQDQPYRI